MYQWSNPHVNPPSNRIIIHRFLDAASNRDSTCKIELRNGDTRVAENWRNRGLLQSTHPVFLVVRGEGPGTLAASTRITIVMVGLDAKREVRTVRVQNVISSLLLCEVSIHLFGYWCWYMMRGVLCCQSPYSVLFVELKLSFCQAAFRQQSSKGS